MRRVMRVPRRVSCAWWSTQPTSQDAGRHRRDPHHARGHLDYFNDTLSICPVAVHHEEDREANGLDRSCSQRPSCEMAPAWHRAQDQPENERREQQSAERNERFRVVDLVMRRNTSGLLGCTTRSVNANGAVLTGKTIHELADAEYADQDRSGHDAKPAMIQVALNTTAPSKPHAASPAEPPPKSSSNSRATTTEP